MFSGTLTVGLRPTIVGSGNKKQTGFPLYGVESHTRLILLLFCSTARSESEKKDFSHTTVDCHHGSSLHRARFTTKLRRRMNTQPSLTSLKALGGLCLEVSLRTWGLTHFCINVLRCRTQDRFLSEKDIQKWVRLPRPKRDLKTQITYSPHTWQRGLSA